MMCWARIGGISDSGDHYKSVVNRLRHECTDTPTGTAYVWGPIGVYVNAVLWLR